MSVLGHRNGSHSLKYCPNGPQNWGEKFRPICGQISKESSLLCTQSKIEAKRPKQRFLAGRAVGCDFPNFWDFTKKFRLREIFWHTFDKFWPFGCRATSKRKKNITWLWGAPRSQPLISTSRNWSQKNFLSKNYKISPGQLCKRSSTIPNS